MPKVSSGLKTTLRATDIASVRFRSGISFEHPYRILVQAFRDSHSVKKVRYLPKIKNQTLRTERKFSCWESPYSSPIFSTWNQPHCVPKSDSRRSSTRLTIAAPTARSIRLLSNFRTRRMAVTFTFRKKCSAASTKDERSIKQKGNGMEMQVNLNQPQVLNSIIYSHMALICSSLISRILA